MANIKIDTTRLESNGKRIVELSKQYSNLIDDMFDKINKVVKNNWSGNASDIYRSYLKNDKEFFLKFYSNIKQYGDELITHASTIQTKIRKWERE